MSKQKRSESSDKENKQKLEATRKKSFEIAEEKTLESSEK